MAQPRSSSAHTRRSSTTAGDEPTGTMPEEKDADSVDTDAADDAGSVEQDLADEMVRYTVSELRAHARDHFACSPHAVAGALSADPEKLWTVEEAAPLVQALLSQEYGA